MKVQPGAKTMMMVMAGAIGFIGLVGLFASHYDILGFGKANRLNYGLILLAVAAAIVGGYFLLKKHEESEKESKIFTNMRVTGGIPKVYDYLKHH